MATDYSKTMGSISKQFHPGKFSWCDILNKSRMHLHISVYKVLDLIIQS